MSTSLTQSTAHAEPRSIKNLYVSAWAYNVLTLTDGALRTIVLLFLIEQKFTAIALAIMFSLYEFMGIFTNFYGGVLGARYGMRFLLLSSVLLQLGCVILLGPLQVVFKDLSNPAVRDTTTITVYVVVSQMLSGMSKDLMKIQGKSVPKLCTKGGDDDRLFKVVSVLTGMKNSVKGVGFLLGSVLVWGVGWVGALCVVGALLFFALIPALVWMEDDLGISKKAEKKAKVTMSAFKKGWNVNVLSSARFFLFGSRDVWFEIAAPFFFRSVLYWAPYAVGFFMAGYTIIYGQLQVLTSQLYSPTQCLKRIPNRSDVWKWAITNAIEILALGIANYFVYRMLVDSNFTNTSPVTITLIVGIIIFAALFAASSAVHSFLIVKYSDNDKVSMDVGFYYMSNAGGRMVGTLISGFIYTYTVDDFGLSVCLWVAAGFLLISTAISVFLRPDKKDEDAEMTDDEVAENGNKIEPSMSEKQIYTDGGGHDVPFVAKAVAEMTIV